MSQNTERTSAADADALFSVLSHERRRYALYCLRQHGTPLALPDLADEVARFESDERSLAEIPAEDVRSVYLDLYHTHVPKMADADLVEYDQDTDSVLLRREPAIPDLEDVV